MLLLWTLVDIRVLDMDNFGLQWWAVWGVFSTTR